MNFPAQVVVLGIVNDAYDLPARIIAMVRIGIFQVLASTKALADRILGGKIGSHERFVDDGRDGRLRFGRVRTVRARLGGRTTYSAGVKSRPS